jgi:hypothetical protein
MEASMAVSAPEQNNLVVVDKALVNWLDRVNTTILLSEQLFLFWGSLWRKGMACLAWLVTGSA